MEKDVVLNIRLSAEMKKAIQEHAKNEFGLSVGQVIRFLIANELADEGIKLNKPWTSEKPRAIQVEYTSRSAKADHLTALGKIQTQGRK